MLSLMSLVFLGLLLGMRHATDPDHVIAVSTIVSRSRSLRAAAPVGIFWGVGHTTTVFLVGGAIIAFGLVVPPRLGLGMEFSVALMLIGLGAWRLVTSWKKPHTHDQQDTLPVAGRFRMRALGIGFIHGLAGSAAVALLVLGTIRQPAWAMAYLALFGVGTMVGMALVTMAMAIPLMLTAQRFAKIHRGIGVAAAMLSVGFGLFLVYQIGFSDGLFTASPRWTPE